MEILDSSNKMNLWLLPNFFKRIGICFLVFIILLMIIAKSFFYDYFHEHNIVVKRVAISLLVISTFLVIFAREKVETKEVKTRRRTAFISALLFAAGIICINVFLEGWPTDNAYLVSAIFQAVFFYFMNFYLVAIRFGKKDRKS